MSSCRSCGARVIWAETDSGKRMPVDAVPAERGNVRLVYRESGPPLAVVSAVPVAGGRLSHFSSCPEADKHRKVRGAR